LPGVTTVAEASSLPPDLLTFSNNYSVEGPTLDTAGASGVAEWNMVSPDYFRRWGSPSCAAAAFEGQRVATPRRASRRRERGVRSAGTNLDGHALGKRLKGRRLESARAMD
jgi:hypothetical protein